MMSLRLAVGACLFLVVAARADGPLFQSDAHGLRAAAIQPGFQSAATGLDDALALSAAWAAIGPFGGDVADVARSPSAPGVVLAGVAPAGASGGTLYRSTDAGANWSAVAQLSGRSVFAIEFSASGTAYIGTDDSVWRSSDDGASWTQLNLNIGLNDTVRALAIEPNNPNRIWAGVDEAFGQQNKNLVRSVDAGENWANVTPALATPLAARGIAFDPNNNTKVYVCFGGAFGNGQFWVSSNGGTNWTNRSAGLPLANPMNDVVHTGTRVLVCGGQQFGAQNVGLYQTINDGLSWTPLHDATWPSLVINDIALDPNDPDVIMLASAGTGVFYTTGGNLWSFGIGGTLGKTINAVRFAPASSLTVFLGASSLGILKSTDGGAQFDIMSRGLAALNITSIAANPLNPDELAVAFSGLNDGGVYASTDAGETWTLQSAPPTRWNAVKFSPLGALFALSDGPTSVAKEALYRRGLGGVWFFVGPDPGSQFEAQLYAIAFSEFDPNFFVLGGNDFGVAGLEATIWRTPNSGSNWTKTYEGTASESVTAIEIIDDGTDTRLLASFTDFSAPGATGGALRSTTGGVSWVPANTGLPAGVQGAALSRSPDSSLKFFLADRGSEAPAGGLHVTTDAGATWANTGYLTAIRDVVCSPVCERVLFALHSAAPKVRVSYNGGLTFQAFDSGLAGAGGVNDLAFANSSANRLLFAATNSSYRTDAPVAAPADLNCDCGVDAFDIGAFTLALTNQAAYESAFPDCDARLADLDGNGAVDSFDIAPFVECITLLGCP